MAAVPSIGTLAQFGMNVTTTLTAGAATEAYEFLSENIAADQGLILTDGLRGSRAHVIDRVKAGLRHLGGTVVLEPNPDELLNLLPRMVGAAAAQSGFNTFSVSDTVPVAFQVIIDRVAKVHTYVGCRVGKWVISASKGGVMKLSLEIEALQDSVAAAGTFAVLTISTKQPFVFTDGVITLGGTTYQMMDAEVTCDWRLDKERFVNQTTRTDLPSLDRTVEIKCTVPYTSDTVGLWDAGGSGGTGPGGVSGIAARLDFSYGGAGQGAAGQNFRMDLTNVIFPSKKSPTVSAKQEVTMVLDGLARKSGSTVELLCSLDNTP